MQNIERGRFSFKDIELEKYAGKGKADKVASLGGFYTIGLAEGVFEGGYFDHNCCKYEKHKKEL